MLGLVGNPQSVAQFSELGVVLLLFVIGLELSPKRLWLMRKAVFGVGLAQVLLTGTVIGVVDRKSTRLNSSHGYISYAVFCLKNKTELQSRQHLVCRLQLEKMRLYF